MELTNSQHDFIHTAIEAHISALKRDMETVNDPLITDVIQGRIDDMQPVLEALESGDYTITLEGY